MRHSSENDIHLLLPTCNGVIKDVWIVRDHTYVLRVISENISSTIQSTFEKYHEYRPTSEFDCHI